MDDYLEYVLGQLEGLGELRWRKMFGGIGLYADDLFFALIAGGVLYFKVDDSNRAEFEARGCGPFRPRGEDGGAMNYHEVPEDVLERPREAVRWARRSLEIARQSPRRGGGRARKAARSTTPRLASLRNLGPQSAAWLAEVGLKTREDLERTGSVGAYLRVREARGKASLNLLYALEAALLDVHWTELPGPLKERLREAAGG